MLAFLAFAVQHCFESVKLNSTLQAAQYETLLIKHYTQIINLYSFS